MNTNALKSFATAARTQLVREVGDQLTAVLAADSLARKERPQHVQQLEREAKADRTQLVERVAYTWFNRLAALTYMDRRGYGADLFSELQTALVVTPTREQSVPELLQLARAGQFDGALAKLDRERLTRLLTRQLASDNPDAEVYRALLIATCNLWHEKMPFLFEELDDYTELLVPRDLLSENSVLTKMRRAIADAVPAGDDPDQGAGDNVEVIGWLYQFYIADKKDEVFGRKSGTKIEAKDIPAATQLFTPHWIVRYLVENSLGRLWILNNPGSDLQASMEYYIAPEDAAAEQATVLKIGGPEEIKVCDPACGSGHMLTYAFDLLMRIYESKAYRPSEAVAAILGHNLYGIEIDERAGGLAAFALAMKARAYDKRYFRRAGTVQPNVLVLQNVVLSAEELDAYTQRAGRDLFTADLKETLTQFEQAKNFGSLIQPALRNVADLREQLAAMRFEEDLYLSGTHRKVQLVLKQADYLSPRYQVVVANPPYMGSKGMNAKLSAFAKTNYPDSKSDLFAMFMERCLTMNLERGSMGMINMQSWMFLSSYEKLRKRLLTENHLVSMAHLGERAFDTISGSVVSTTAFIFKKAQSDGRNGVYFRLVDKLSESLKAQAVVTAIIDNGGSYTYWTSVEDFNLIPGSPIAYWVRPEILKSFENKKVGDIAICKQGLATGDNDRFLRYWHEVPFDRIKQNLLNGHLTEERIWVPYSKGGSFRKWYGNDDYVILWEDNGNVIRNFKDSKGRERSRFRGAQHYFEPAATWSLTSSNKFGVRLRPAGAVYDINGMSLFAEDSESLVKTTALLNSGFAEQVLQIINPTIAYQAGDIASVPVINFELPASNASALDICKSDWNSFETSIGFETFQLVLMGTKHSIENIVGTYWTFWSGEYLKVRDNERRIDKAIFSEIGIVGEMPMRLSGIELLRFSNSDESEVLNPGITHAQVPSETAIDIVCELLSYYLGTLFGRYSLDAPGLILADAGATVADYLARVPKPSFAPDEDGIVPFVDSGWFKDDVVREWERFLRAAFGPEHLEENKAFVDATLGKSVRDYFLKDLYDDHVKRYKKRPIYWMFASDPGKGKKTPAFQCLVYLHRYTPDTCGKIMEDYLKPLIRQLEDRLLSEEEISASTGSQFSAREQSQSAAAAEDLRTKLKECRTYAGVLQPYVDNPIHLDLDDGVLVNYNRFGRAVVEVGGLNDKKAREKVLGFGWCDISRIPKYGQ